MEGLRAGVGGSGLPAEGTLSLAPSGAGRGCAVGARAPQKGPAARGGDTELRSWDGAVTSRGHGVTAPGVRALQHLLYPDVPRAQLDPAR